MTNFKLLSELYQTWQRPRRIFYHPNCSPSTSALTLLPSIRTFTRRLFRLSSCVGSALVWTDRTTRIRSGGTEMRRGLSMLRFVSASFWIPLSPFVGTSSSTWIATSEQCHVWNSSPQSIATHSTLIPCVPSCSTCRILSTYLQAHLCPAVRKANTIRRCHGWVCRPALVHRSMILLVRCSPMQQQQNLLWARHCKQAPSRCPMLSIRHIADQYQWLQKIVQIRHRARPRPCPMDFMASFLIFSISKG